jgi:hypothetical protein
MENQKKPKTHFSFSVFVKREQEKQKKLQPNVQPTFVAQAFSNGQGSEPHLTE